MFLLQYLAIGFDIDSTIKDGRFDGWQILGKAFVFVSNLKGQFTSVTQDQHLDRRFGFIGGFRRGGGVGIGNDRGGGIFRFPVGGGGGGGGDHGGRIQLMQGGQNKDGGFPHSRLGLTDDIPTQYGLGDTLVLDLRWMFKARIDDTAQQFWFQEEVLKARRVDPHVMTRGSGTGALFGGGRRGSGGGSLDIYYNLLCSFIFIYI